MKLELVRGSHFDTCTIGHVYVDAAFECFSLENPDRMVSALGPEHIAIPCGTYKIIMYDSPKFGRRVPILLDVPGRTFVEIHMGNTSRDTHGCILVGHGTTDDTISRSVLALDALCAKIEKALETETVEITIREAA